MEPEVQNRSGDKNIVIVFSGKGANDAIAGLMIDYANALTEAGLSVVQITLEQSEINYAVELMRDGEVLFAMTWLGIGQNISVRATDSDATFNAFEAYRVPLVKLQGDLPAYFIDMHRDVPKNSINLYQAQEFLDFRRRWLPDAQAISSLLPPMPMVPAERTTIDIESRKRGRLFFIKNGNSPKALEDLWETALTPRLAQIVRGMADAVKAECLRAAPVRLGDWVSEYLTSTRIAMPVPPRLLWFFAAQLDDYLRRIKSTLIAEALLDFPIIVQGSFWDHVDFHGRRAKLVPPKDVFQSQEIVLKELGVIDMSANVDSWPHDRVQRAAGAYSLFLTNCQGWLSEKFPDFVDMTFAFDRESIAARVSEVLNHPRRYLEMALAFGDEFRTVFPRANFAETVLRLVDYARLMWENPRPQLQNFFVWTEYD
ncbi:MAG: hypothetical protein ACYC9Z_05025 [Casimicrobiaceae bacterium]